MSEDNTPKTTLNDINDKIEDLVKRIKKFELQISYLDLYKISSYYEVEDSSSIETAFSQLNLYSSFIVSINEKTLNGRGHSLENNDVILKLVGNQEYIVKSPKSTGCGKPLVENNNIIGQGTIDSPEENSTVEVNLPTLDPSPGITLIYENSAGSATGGTEELSLTTGNFLMYKNSNYPPFSLNHFTQNYEEKVFCNYNGIGVNDDTGMYGKYVLPSGDLIKIIEVF